jgi:glycosyltransferase involved in cell wall biosynthesis
VVVTLGPWLDEELTPLFGTWPSIHVFDEDLSRMPEIAPQSRQARLLRAAELAVRRRRLPVPRSVVVIAPHEVAHARTRFGKAPRVVVVPQTLPAAQWPLHGDRSSGNSVFCVGNLAEPRNADALADVLVELQHQPNRPAELSLVLVSGTGFSPRLVAVSEAQPWVRLVDRADDLVPFYRSARLALVPAGRATGFKATILQAWLCGTPVVVSAASAATVAPEQAAAVVEAASPRELAATILELWRDDAELDRLAGAGRVAARDGHDDARTLAEWCDLVLTAAAEPLR